MINVIGQCGPVLGTRIYPTRQAPRFVEGMSICAAFMFFCAVMALALRLLLVWENKKLDRKYAHGSGNSDNSPPTSLERRKDGIAVENYGPEYRYVL